MRITGAFLECGSGPKYRARQKIEVNCRFPATESKAILANNRGIAIVLPFGHTVTTL
jgi:hypothetical protein